MEQQQEQQQRLVQRQEHPWQHQQAQRQEQQQPVQVRQEQQQVRQLLALRLLGLLVCRKPRGQQQRLQQLKLTCSFLHSLEKNFDQNF